MEKKTFLLLGDNKEQNQRLGFQGGFTGLHCCRFCKMHINDIRIKVNSLGAIRRNRENYDSDVALKDPSGTGVNEFSPFNRIPCFHVTESATVDITHDLTEGILHRILPLSILHFIKQKCFDLACLNRRMKSMDYGEAEKGNRPIAITMKNLSNNKLKMSASEMFFFAHHLTLMIGDLVPDSDPVWQYLLTAIKFMDLCYLPSYSDDDLSALQIENEKVNKGLIELFGSHLKHKSHLGTHYAELIDEVGPLRYIQTIR